MAVEITDRGQDQMEKGLIFRFKVKKNFPKGHKEFSTNDHSSFLKK